ncbi:MAG: MerR family transcriptional regulator [Betaproteobacteria bacterium]
MPDHSRVKAELPPIPAKRYFTIGEVSDLCAVKPHVLRYWEQEFAQLKPVKRRGNRRYYQHHEVLLIRRIRDLLYEQGFTINGARHRLESDVGTHAMQIADTEWPAAHEARAGEIDISIRSHSLWNEANKQVDLVEIRQELEEIRQLLGHDS